MNITPINVCQTKRQNNPNFKGITVSSKLRDEVLDIVANSKNIKKLGKLYNIDISEGLAVDIKNYIVTLLISRKDPTARSNNNQFKKLLQKLLSSTKCKVEKPKDEKKIYEMSLYNIPKLFGTSEKQLKTLTPKKMEKFIKKEDLKNVEIKQLELKRNKNLDNLKELENL